MAILAELVPEITLPLSMLKVLGVVQFAVPESNSGLEMRLTYFTSVGQVSADPVHSSAGSERPVEARHVLPSVIGTLLRQLALVPLQCGTVAQSPREFPQEVALLLKPSAGQSTAPVQYSATSQVLEAARQTVLVG